jgi:hypothetical protein
MLEKIETTYLAAMRVIVLVAATLALLVVVGGLVVGAPQLSAALGATASEPKVEGVDLATFVAEQKAATAGTSVDGTASAAEDEPIIVPGKLGQAGRIFADYLLKHHGINVDRVTLQLNLLERRNQLPIEVQTAYEDSLLKLARDLEASTGRPLSPENTYALVEWHASRVQAAAEQAAAERVASAARGTAALVEAGTALIAFIIILFFFVFVKIERNLRLVRTREVAS